MATRKDFEATARILRAIIRDVDGSQGYNVGTLVWGTESQTYGTVCRASRDFARVYAGQNEQFNRARFLTACGLEPRDVEYYSANP